MPLVSTQITDARLCLSWAIDAPVATAWEGLTAPSALERWLGRLVAGELAAGRSFVIDHGEGYRCESTVTSRVPERELAYSWRFPDEPLTEVSWTLRGDGEATALLLTHRDLGDLADSYRAGWMVHLTFLEAWCLGSPLPERIFWPLHSTFVRLASPRSD